jgi:hypothetical protein
MTRRTGVGRVIPPNLGAMNTLPRLPDGPRIWSTDVAGGRMHVIVDGRAVVAPTRADLSKLEGRP